MGHFYKRQCRNTVNLNNCIESSVSKCLLANVTSRKPPCSLKQKQQNVSAEEGIPATQAIALIVTYEAPPPLLYDLVDISSDEMGSADEQPSSV